MKRTRKWAALLLCLCMALMLMPTTAFAANGNDNTFTVTYKTNAGVVMGTVEYPAEEGNLAFPETGEFRSLFSDFVSRALQKGGLYLPSDPSLRWYEDAEFTVPAAFPEGQAGESYDVYCKITLLVLEAGTSYNTAENASYSKVKDTFQPFLGFSGNSIAGRNDMDTAKFVFEKKIDGQWVTVPDDYFVDHNGIEWPNMIWFNDVADSGIYRLKYYRYTATDNSGDILYYVDAYDPADGEYSVSIAPAELTISGVTAPERLCDGTTEVALEGGILEGVLYGDDVSFERGTGTVADPYAGTGKTVTTDIQLTGSKAGNYVLKQPEDVTTAITCGAVKVEAKPATCTETGIAEYWYCENCDLYYKDASLTTRIEAPEVTPAMGHNFETAWKADDANHWHSCSVCGEKSGIKPHSYGEWLVTKAATAAEEGTREKICSICGYKVTETIPATGKTENAESPNMGDPNHSMLWIILMILASAGLMGLIYAKKPKAND